MSGMKFWKPGGELPTAKLKEERDADIASEGSGTAAWFNPNISLSMEQQRQRLPVFKFRNHILYLAEKYQTVVIIGETGCGKSTQIPQYLAEAGWCQAKKMVGVSLPRRVAVTNVSTRVCEEKASILGHEVGYTVRFDDMSDPETTKIKFMTDGILVREMMGDPLLTKYSVIMIDEAHERTLYTDIAIGLLKKIMKKRKDLHVIVASATLDAETFRDFFNLNKSGDKSLDTAAILTVEGRMFPVDIFYLNKPCPDYVRETVNTIVKIHRTEKAGDVLAFLTGMDEIEQAVSLVKEYCPPKPQDKMELLVLPMYSSLPIAEQLRVFKRTPQNTRKVVIATNIAEASITINGIGYVVDSGFVKLPAYRPQVGTESLVVMPVSRASAKQRAGRAGRVRSGKAYRLYTEEDHDGKLQPATVPEMQRSNLATVVLQLKALGIVNVLRFDFIARPPAQNMLRALELLYALDAIDEDGQLTSPLGVRMAEFPLNPMFAKMLLVSDSDEFSCSEEMVTIAAMLQVQNVFVQPSRGQDKILAARARRKFSVIEGDHLTLLNVYTAFVERNKNSKWCREQFLNYRGLCRAAEIREQLCRLLKKFKVQMVSCEGDISGLCQCIVKGFFANAARLHYTGEYRTVRNDHPLNIHPTSVLYGETPQPQWVVFNELVQTNMDYMRDITVIQPSWLYEHAPHYYEYGTERELHETKRLKSS